MITNTAYLQLTKIARFSNTEKALVLAFRLNDNSLDNNLLRKISIVFGQLNTALELTRFLNCKTFKNITDLSVKSLLATAKQTKYTIEN